MNQLKTTIFLALLTALLVFLGGAMGGKTGMVMALGLAGIMNFLAYWYSDKIVLAMYGAQEVGPAEAPVLYGIVQELAQRAGIPMPRVYIIPTESPNAFATGRSPKHAAVAATQGILRILNRDELMGVMAHELGHVIHRDTLIATIAATIAGAISMLANWLQWAVLFGMGRGDDEEGPGLAGGLIMAIIAPIAATLVQMAVSRSREFLADEAGAQLSGKPLALASALGKLQQAAHMMPMDANPATSHLFIVNPLSGSNVLALFSTHPPVEERIARLKAMAGR
ncbi:protease HtpX [Thermodesulfomicrobium sp. WS]|uniref:zinc metalloprotease HtpX n=1 Tax=Thermodesulfomicrobium sp. WS TaxID=3004129 RepID=UPI002493A11B|nr:zinc metalloprotease HtpX [Thermodesulfomicrobium sp. WS]BDV02111.1 protease HtpX [Thermodesulfomicrobium sp. WS]